MSVDAQLKPSEPQPRPDEQYVTVAASIRRHKLLAAFPVVLFLAAALVYGLVRQPGYTATAELHVSGINLGQPGAWRDPLSSVRCL